MYYQLVDNQVLSTQQGQPDVFQPAPPPYRVVLGAAGEDVDEAAELQVVVAAQGSRQKKTQGVSS